MNSLDLRIATKDDVSYISILGRKTFTETFGHLFRDPSDLDTYLENTFSVAKITSSLDKKVNIFWIAFANGIPVGYAKLKLDSNTPFITQKSICQLQKIYVLKEYLSLKIGKELQIALLNKAKSLGYAYIWLSVLNTNERAIQFYKKNKFTLIGSHNFSIGKEDFKFFAMGKVL